MASDESTGDPVGEAVRSLTIEFVVSEHLQSVYRYAYRLSGQVHEAEDLTQETFRLAQLRLHQLRDPQKLLSWLFSILRSCFLKARRKKLPIPTDSLPEAEDPAGTTSLDFIDREHLQQALNQLSEEARVVLMLFYFEDMAYKDIATELDVPIGTVMSRLARAKQRLKKVLGELSGESSSQSGSNATSTIRQEA